LLGIRASSPSKNAYAKPDLRSSAPQTVKGAAARLSGSRGGCPPRLPQNRTYAVRIRLLGTAGCEPRRRPVIDLDSSPLQRELELGGGDDLPRVAVQLHK
jgi:hypothetical protein